jgi:hypothetical protein
VERAPQAGTHRVVVVDDQHVAGRSTRQMPRKTPANPFQSTGFTM